MWEVALKLLAAMPYPSAPLGVRALPFRTPSGVEGILVLPLSGV